MFLSVDTSIARLGRRLAFGVAVLATLLVGAPRHAWAQG